ncbi:MAG TPA: 30S ribosomal protein S7 [Candidatus Saccharimonadales bacterium]|nr:30S ribosomal protein S7 [Candidatus Saccharimonadales bacterium]
MRGNRKIKKVALELDPKYRDPVLTKFINKLMWGGKKETAQTIVYEALERLGKETNLTAPQVLQAVIDKAAPILEVKSRRVGGATYQVPMEVKPARKTVLVMRWLLEASRGAKAKPMAEKLYLDMKAILENTGPVIKKREDLHKMAEANRAFAHFARY